jgi:hypothetical protein
MTYDRIGLGFFELYMYSVLPLNTNNKTHMCNTIQCDTYSHTHSTNRTKLLWLLLFEVSFLARQRTQVNRACTVCQSVLLS